MMTKTEKDNLETFEIDLKALAQIIRVGWKAFISVFFSILCITAIYSLLQPRLYEAKASFVAPRDQDLKELSVPKVQGVNLVGGQLCEAQPGVVLSPSSGFVVSGEENIPCLVAGNLFPVFHRTLKNEEVRIRAAEATSGSARHRKMLLDNDHGFLEIAVRSSDPKESEELLSNLIEAARYETEEYFRALLRSRIDQEIVRLKMDKAFVFRKSRENVSELVSHLNMVLAYKDQVEIDKISEESSNSEFKDLRVNVKTNSGVTIELKGRSAIVNYLGVLENQIIGAEAQRSVDKIEKNIEELELRRQMTVSFPVYSLLSINVSDKPVEPNYLLIVIPGTITAILAGIFVAFLRFYFVGQRSIY